MGMCSLWGCVPCKVVFPVRMCSLWDVFPEPWSVCWRADTESMGKGEEGAGVKGHEATSAEWGLAYTAGKMLFWSHKDMFLPCIATTPNNKLVHDFNFR